MWLTNKDTNTVNSGGSRPSDKGWGGGHADPEIREGPVSPPQNFSALWASVWSKNKGGGGARPSPGSATGEWFEARSHFMSRLSMIVRVNVVLNRTVVVDGD